ncbi:hypothetical protein D3C85_931620 [compost metagenome]
MEVIQIPSFHYHNWFIEGHPAGDAITEQFEAERCVLGISRHGFAALPAPLLLPVHRHVEVEQADEGFDPLGQQLIDNFVVEVDGLLVDGVAIRQQPGPGDGCAEAVVANLLHQRDVFAIAIVEGGGVGWAYLTVKTVWLRLEPVIPDGRCLAAHVGSPFRLCGRRGATPPEAFGECVLHCSFLLMTGVRAAWCPHAWCLRLTLNRCDCVCFF